MGLYQRKKISSYPRYLFLLLNLITIIIHIVFGVLIDKKIGYNEWQLYCLIYAHAYNIIVTLMIPMVISLATVSLPKYSEMWQIIFTIFLFICFFVMLGLHLFLNNSEQSLLSQMKFLAEKCFEDAGDLLHFFYLELQCAQFDDTNTSCTYKAVNKLREVMPSIHTYSIILVCFDLGNFLINFLYLLIFSTPDPTKKAENDKSGSQINILFY